MWILGENIIPEEAIPPGKLDLCWVNGYFYSFPIRVTAGGFPPKNPVPNTGESQGSPESSDFIWGFGWSGNSPPKLNVPAFCLFSLSALHFWLDPLSDSC